MYNICMYTYHYINNNKIYHNNIKFLEKKYLRTIFLQTYNDT